MLHKALSQLSDMCDRAMATLVYPMCVRLLDYSAEPSAPSKLTRSIARHVARLSDTHFMKFWGNVMWFSPEWITLVARPSGKAPISADRANDLFQSGYPMFSISPAAWHSFISCQDFQYAAGTSDEAWWDMVGRELFPTIYEAAMGYLFVPPLVTACDSILSILGHKYSARQASIGTDVVSTQMFLRSNLRVL